MLLVNFEDLQGSVEVVIFPRTVEEYGHLVREDAVLVISGRVDQRSDGVKVIAEAGREPNLSAEEMVRVRVPTGRLSKITVDRLKSTLENHPGTALVYLHMVSQDSEKVVRLGDSHRVQPRSSLFAELRELFGPRAVL